MQCTSCGAEIAEKAIVCYRCGAPTAIPEAARRVEPPAPRPGTNLVWVAVLAIVISVLALVFPGTEAGTWPRIGVYAGVLVSAAAALMLILMRRRR